MAAQGLPDAPGGGEVKLAPLRLGKRAPLSAFPPLGKTA